MKGFLAFICAFTFAPDICAADGKPSPAPELRWARDIAKDFLDSLLEFDYDAAAGLLSPELFRTEDTRTRRLDWVMSYKTNASVSLTHEELAPDRSEAIFRGTMSAMYEVTAKKTTWDFSLR